MPIPVLTSRSARTRTRVSAPAFLPKRSATTRTAAAAATLLAGAALTAYLAAGARRPYPVAGKVVLITGGSRGLGLALAETFGRAGARLVLTARDPEELDRARALLVQRGAAPTSEHILLLPCDLTDPAATEHMVASATLLLGRIDILINNAGIITVGPVENQPLRAFRDAMEINYFGMLHATLALLPQMLARSRAHQDPGAVVNIASIGGKLAVPHLLPYSASKFAAVGWSQGLHSELANKGIRVTTVTPGLMRTGSPGKALFVGDREKEFRWFHLSASLPGVAASADHAARRILKAVETGEGELSITPQAALAARLAQVAPALTSGLLSLVNTWLLPAPANQTTSRIGRDHPTPDHPTQDHTTQDQPTQDQPTPGEQVSAKALRSLTLAGDRAATRWNQ